MKNKFLLFIPALLSVFLLASCKKEVVTNYVDQAFSAQFDLYANGWSTSDGGHSYSTVLTVPQIDNYLLQNGAVNVYLSFDGGDHFEAVPEVYSGISYGAIHQLGQVILDIHAVDGSVITTPPGDGIIAKVVLVDADPLY